MNPIFTHILAGVMLFVGFLGVFLPVLPGIWLAWGGLLLCRFAAPDGAIGTTTVIVFGVLCALAQLFDVLGAAWGVKRFGGTWRGMVGAVAGLFLGMIFLSWLPLGVILGMVVGSAIGAVIGEYLGGAEFQRALKAGGGTVVGWLATVIVKACLVAAMIAWFLIAVVVKALE